MDARLFFDLAVEHGFDAPALLLGAQATRIAVRGKLRELAALSEPGDLCLITFSGHGGRKCVRGPSGAPQEVGAWQLYDGSLNEQEFMEDLARFRQDVRVLVVADHCGGGMPGRRAPHALGNGALPLAVLPGQEAHSTGAIASGHCASSEARASSPTHERVLKASVLVFAACEEGKYADGEGLPGHFASAIKRTLNGRGFDGSYADFHRALCRQMPPYQQADYYRLGPRSGVFEAQHPFAI